MTRDYKLYTSLGGRLTQRSKVLLKDFNVLSVSQEITRILWNHKFPYRIHNSPPLVPFSIQINPVQAPNSIYRKIDFNIIPPAHVGESIAYRKFYVWTLNNASFGGKKVDPLEMKFLGLVID